MSELCFPKMPYFIDKDYEDEGYDQRREAIKKRFFDSRTFILEPIPSVNLNDLDLDAPLDLPFSNCIFEMTDGSFFILGDNETKESMVVKAFMVMEVGFNTYEFFYLTEVRGELQSGFLVEDMTGEPSMILRARAGYVFLKKFTALSLQHMNASYMASEKVNFRYKLKIDGIKKVCKIKQVIHITSKKYVTNPIGGEHAEIDWSHRWEVRGHWRKIDGLGKNRENEYIITGYTWVLPHEKGPENKLLVKKTRLVRAEEVSKCE